MPPYHLVTWSEIATSLTLVQLLEAHEVCDEVDVQMGRDRSAQWRTLIAVLYGTG
jgi:hypothetical protein